MDNYWTLSSGGWLWHGDAYGDGKRVADILECPITVTKCEAKEVVASALQGESHVLSGPPVESPIRVRAGDNGRFGG
jgi:hypothetical protein